MNYRGSYRRLLGNAMSAMVGAIEIYNKPRFAYRDEVVVILLINAWELLLKANLSKNGQSIYYRKERGKPYRTLGWRDSFWWAANSRAWPQHAQPRAVEANLDLVATYRDSAVHFYTDPSFGSLIYSLAQTSIINFRDVAAHIFGRDIAKEITWQIMPLGVTNPIDPISFMRGSGSDIGAERSKAVQDFLAFLKEKTDGLEVASVDTGRLMTVFNVSLQSTKKISNADIVVGVSSDELADAVVVERKVDPNVSHPYRQKDLLPKLRSNVSTYVFQAVAYTHKLRQNPRYCWIDSTGSVVKWSSDTLKYVDSLTDEQFAEARRRYAARFRGSGRSR